MADEQIETLRAMAKGSFYPPSVQAALEAGAAALAAQGEMHQTVGQAKQGLQDAIVYHGFGREYNAALDALIAAVQSAAQGEIRQPSPDERKHEVSYSGVARETRPPQECSCARCHHPESSHTDGRCGGLEGFGQCGCRKYRHPDTPQPPSSEIRQPTDQDDMREVFQVGPAGACPICYSDPCECAKPDPAIQQEELRQFAAKHGLVPVLTGEGDRREKDLGAALLPVDPSASPATTEALPNKE